MIMAMSAGLAGVRVRDIANLRVRPRRRLSLVAQSGTPAHRGMTAGEPAPNVPSAPRRFASFLRSSWQAVSVIVSPGVIQAGRSWERSVIAGETR